MYDWFKSRPQRQVADQGVCTPSNPTGMGSNQAVIDSMAGESEARWGGYLGSFLRLDEVQKGANATPNFTPTAANDDFMKMNATEGNLSLASNRGMARLYSDGGGSDGRRYQDEAFGAVGWDGALTLGGSVGNSRYEDPTKDPVAKSGVSGSVSGDGVLQVDVKAEAGGTGGALSGRVDLDAEGGLQAFGVDGSLKTAGVEVGAGFSVQRESIEVKGNTVSWESGKGGQVKAKTAGVGGKIGRKDRKVQSATFPSALEAMRFAEQLGAGQVEGGAELGSDALDALQPGTSFEFGGQKEVGFGGGVMVGLGVESGRSTNIRVERGEGSAATLTVDRAASTGIEGEVSNGVIGVDTGLFDSVEMRRVYQLDLDNPQDREAFDRFQETGEIEGLELLSGYSFSDSGGRRGASLPLLGVEQSWSQGEGKVVLDGDVFDVDRGSNTESISTGNLWDGLYGGAEALSEYGPLPGWRLAGALYTEASFSPEQRFSEYGSPDGSLEGEMEIMMPGRGSDEQKWMNTKIKQTEYINLVDRQESTKALLDAVTPTMDQSDFDGPLPEHEAMSRRWKLETQIEERGAFNVLQQFAQDRTWMMELEGLKAVDGAENAFGAGSPDSFREALAVLAAQGGPDALEGIREAAGSEYYEQYLALEGDENWQDKKGNEALDRRVERIIETEPERIHEIKKEELARREAILVGDYLEVPPGLRDAELARIDARLEQLEEK